MSSERTNAEEQPNEEWPDKEFLETALRNWLKDPKIKVTEFRSRLATKKGDNYTSEIFRVTVKFGQRTGAMSFIVKRLSNFGSNGESFSKGTAQTREEAMFGSVLPKMHAELKKAIPDVEPFGAYYVYSDPIVLMMEDLQTGGFWMAPRRAFLDLKTCSLVLHTLARFHAASVVLMEREAVDLSVFRKSTFVKSNFLLDNYCTGMINTLSEELKNMKGLERYAAKVAAFNGQNFLNRLKHAVEDNEADDFLVIAHADFWVNNILFRYSPSGEVDGVRFVDFQFTFISSPCIDLHYFLNSSSDETVRTTCINKLIEEYHETLCKTMEALKCSTRPPTVEKLKKDYDKRSLYGLFSVFCCMPLVLSRDGQVDLSDVADGKSPTGELFRSDAYKKALEFFLPLFERKGLL